MAPEAAGDVIWMRPEHAATGRPAKRSREEITAVAITIADQDGLDAVSMRRVAAELGTGAGALYRYVDTREDLLDLMTDSTGAEYAFTAPTGDWLADLLAIGEQARDIMRRHQWLPSLLITRSTLGPNGPTSSSTSWKRSPRTPPAPQPSSKPSPSSTPPPHCSSTTCSPAARPGSSATPPTCTTPWPPDATRDSRNCSHQHHQPRPAHPAAPDPADRYRDILARILNGLLAPEPPPA